MTVFEFAKKCMNDKEFCAGGIVKNEKKQLDAVGFSYMVERGEIAQYGDDAEKFYSALVTLVKLQKKYQSIQG